MPNLGILKKPDWSLNEDTSDACYVRNKPLQLTSFRNDLNLSTVAYTGSYSDLLNKPPLAPVATSGNYGDLLNKPTLAPVAATGNYTDLVNAPVLAPVATSGDYTQLTSKPGSISCWPNAGVGMLNYFGQDNGGLGIPGAVKAQSCGTFNVKGGIDANGNTCYTFAHGCRPKLTDEFYIVFLQPWGPAGDYSLLATLRSVDNNNINVNILKMNGNTGQDLYAQTYPNNDIHFNFLVLLAGSNTTQNY